MISTFSNSANPTFKQLAIATNHKRTPAISCCLSTGGSPNIDLRIQEIIKERSQIDLNSLNGRIKPEFPPLYLEESYQSCKKICAENAKTFYLGSLLLTKERQKAIWAIYAWCTRLDEVVDGENAQNISQSVLDQWKERLEHIFNGNPSDILDFALADTVFNFALDIKPFKDMIKGMKMDTEKCRYENFEELYEYCYCVAGTVALMTVPVFGIASDTLVSTQTIYNGALCLAIGNQLTNILRDVTEDAMRGRIYLPQDELLQFGVCENDIFARNANDRWREFTKEQIIRARYYFNIAEDSISLLDETSRWPVWSSLMLYRKILGLIENNGYDNLTKVAHVGKFTKLLTLSFAFAKSQSSPILLHKK